jgi:hypothetical protein
MSGSQYLNGRGAWVVLEFSSTVARLTDGWPVRQRILLSPESGDGGLKTLLPGSVDVAILNEILSQVADVEMTLTWIREALRPGGRLHVIERRSEWSKSSLSDALVGAEFFVQRVDVLPLPTAGPIRRSSANFIPARPARLIADAIAP